MKNAFLRKFGFMALLMTAALGVPSAHAQFSCLNMTAIWLGGSPGGYCNSYSSSENCVQGVCLRLTTFQCGSGADAVCYESQSLNGGACYASRTFCAD